MKCYWIRLCILLVSIWALAACAEPAENEELLSVDETMGVIFRGSGDYHLFRRANPDARPAIHAFLEDEVLVGYHPQAIRILGWIGETSDVVALRKMTNRLEGPLQWPDDRKMRAILEAWATMARRGVPGAEAEIKKFCASKAWTEAAFSWVDPALVKRKPQHAYNGPIAAIRVYSIHGDGNMKQLREQLLSEVQHQGARDRINYYLTEKRIIAAIEKRREQEARPVTAQDRERLRGQLQRIKAVVAGQKGTPAKEVPKADAIESAPVLSQSLSGDVTVYAQALVKEGLTAYGQLLNELLSEKYDALLKSILNNGRPLDPGKVNRNRDAFVKDLQVERSLMAEAQRSGLLDESRYRNFQVNVSLTASVERIVAEKLETESVNGTETVSLLFVIPESADIYKRHMPQVGVGSAELTITREGELQVYMKRINGKWYWNPFGW